MYRRITLEQVLFGTALLVGAGVRLWNLGAAPLTDQEAALALRALNIAQGQAGEIGSQPVYTMFTGFLFFLFGSSNGIARLLPALAGLGLVVLPAVFRRQLGSKAAILLSFGLALDPGLAALSRQIGSSTLVAVTLLAGFGWLGMRKYSLAGVFIGLALMSGPAVIQGGFSLVLVWWILQRLSPRLIKARAENQHADPSSSPGQALSGRIFPVGWIDSDSLRIIGGSAGITILLVGTLFMVVPGGLAAWMDILPEYFQSMFAGRGVSPVWFFVSLVVYSPLALVYGILGSIRFWWTRDYNPDADEFLEMERTSTPIWSYQRRIWIAFLSLWCMVSFIFAFVYPGRQMGDHIWVLIAFWALAAMEIDEQLLPVLEPKLVVLLHAMLTFIFLALFWLQLSAVTRVIDVVQFDWVRFGLLFGVLLLVVLIASIVNMGWSGMIAKQGLGFGVIAALGIFTLAGLQGTTQTTPWNEIIRQELWLVYPQAGNVDLLKGTLNDLSIWNTGRSEAIDIASAVESPSLNWALREFYNVTQLPEHSSIATLNNQGPENMPAIIISRVVDETPELASYYRGQDIEWWISPEVGNLSLNSALRWLVFRQGSWYRDVFILWARSDLFPGGILEPAQEDDNPVLDGIEPYE